MSEPDLIARREAVALALCNEHRRFGGFSRPYTAGEFAALPDHRRRDWLRYAGVVVALEASDVDTVTWQRFVKAAHARFDAGIALPGDENAFASHPKPEADDERRAIDGRRVPTCPDNDAGAGILGDQRSTGCADLEHPKPEPVRRSLITI